MTFAAVVEKWSAPTDIDVSVRAPDDAQALTSLIVRFLMRGPSGTIYLFSRLVIDNGISHMCLKGFSDCGSRI